MKMRLTFFTFVVLAEAVGAIVPAAAQTGADADRYVAAVHSVEGQVREVVTALGATMQSRIGKDWRLTIQVTKGKAGAMANYDGQAGSPVVVSGRRTPPRSIPVSATDDGSLRLDAALLREALSEALREPVATEEAGEAQEAICGVSKELLPRTETVRVRDAWGRFRSYRAFEDRSGVRPRCLVVIDFDAQPSAVWMAPKDGAGLGDMTRFNVGWQARIFDLLLQMDPSLADPLGTMRLLPRFAVVARNRRNDRFSVLYEFQEFGEPFASQRWTVQLYFAQGGTNQPHHILSFTASATSDLHFLPASAWRDLIDASRIFEDGLSKGKTP
jgi:hypothetical protein